MHQPRDIPASVRHVWDMHQPRDIQASVRPVWDIPLACCVSVAAKVAHRSLPYIEEASQTIPKAIGVSKGGKKVW
ncbi:hypothetical protein F383_12440 [Gossypium arboreum]|uniref:Uncharacterized protein n=1 Tax=Gossypium arboreum TaxID=29729 RepID=A0A0B0NA52_GOSAR|nr:hypothetical protein F383_12440 [Gossypium arboreum]